MVSVSALAYRSSFELVYDVTDQRAGEMKSTAAEISGGVDAISVTCPALSSDRRGKQGNWVDAHTRLNLHEENSTLSIVQLRPKNTYLY